MLMFQDNPPMMSSPQLRLRLVRFRRRRSSRRHQSTRRTTTAAPTTTTTTRSRGAARCWSSTHLSPSVTLRNQTRYNKTTREAVITSIANPAAYNPATNLVLLSRQANERVNEIVSNQTNLSARV